MSLNLNIYSFNQRFLCIYIMKIKSEICQMKLYINSELMRLDGNINTEIEVKLRLLLAFALQSRTL